MYKMAPEFYVKNLSVGLYLPDKMTDFFNYNSFTLCKIFINTLTLENFITYIQRCVRNNNRTSFMVLMPCW